MTEPKLYAERNPRALEPHYSRHMAAMTAEDLHSKSAIAEELAWRDAQIERLQRIIDSRPAINAGLPGTYIAWSRSIYSMEFFHALETPQ